MHTTACKDSKKELKVKTINGLFPRCSPLLSLHILLIAACGSPMRLHSFPLFPFPLALLQSVDVDRRESRPQYKSHVLAVQKPCTRSTKAMYLQYKAHVLAPEGTNDAGNGLRQTVRKGKKLLFLFCFSPVL